VILCALKKLVEDWNITVREIEMFLKSIKYAQFGEIPRLWKLEGCTLDNINLIVGKNATGKSRTLNIINGLANL